jgi:hypothetical protein
MKTFDRVGKLQIFNRNLLGRVEYMETCAEKKESWSDEIRQRVVYFGKDQQSAPNRQRISCERFKEIRQISRRLLKDTGFALKRRRVI